MGNLQEHLTTLEDILVREFRACQTLHTLTKEEQVSLSSGDMHKILTLVEYKESILDDINQLEEKLRKTVSQLAKLVKLPAESATLAEVLATLNNDASERLERLREGILSLLGVVRNLTFGNQAFATGGLERLDAVQAYLLNLFQSITDFNQLGTPSTQPQKLALDFDHRV
jgi:flagellar biosynthesis/type III secretory pathway chaperone